MVLGVRCTKESIFIALLEGDITSFEFTGEHVKPLKIIIPKSYETRESQLGFIYKEITQLIETYNPSRIGIKGHENSPHKVNPTSNAQRGEIEGLVRLVASQKGIVVSTFHYAQTKKLLNLEKGNKKVILDTVRERSGCTVKDESCIDSILMAMVVL